MRYLIILLIFLSGCVTAPLVAPVNVPIKYTPRGDNGDMVQYFIDHSGDVLCDRCGEVAVLFKTTNNKKVVCDYCYRKER